MHHQHHHQLAVQVLLVVMLQCTLMVHASVQDICDRKVCEYSFSVFKMQTMTYRSHNATYNVQESKGRLEIADGFWPEQDGKSGQQIDMEDVITGDGSKRHIITINGQFPGPTIEVMQGAQIVVHVENHLQNELVTLHWHGLHLHNNTWMDGVPYVTQCPILPRQKFTYRVLADNPGTHWYHSHVVGQRLDGVFGMLLVHPKLPVLPYFPVSVMDWSQQDFHMLYVTNPYDADRPGNGEMHADAEERFYSPDSVELSALRYQSALINGRGRTATNSTLPLETFIVQKGKRHRFHMLNSGAEYTFEISVDNHKLIIVASDGARIKPIKVDSLHIFPGERYEFDIWTDQKESSYWMRAQLLTHGKGMFPRKNGEVNAVKAIIKYEASTLQEPVSSKQRCTKAKPCHIFNCPFKGYAKSYNRICHGFTKAVALDIGNEKFRDTYGLDTADEDIFEIMLNFGFSYGSSINARRFVGSSAPFFQNTSGHMVECPENCDDEGCRCTYTVHIPHNKTVQMVLTGMMPDFPFVAHHAIHLHGYDFAVLKMAYGPLNASTGYWEGSNPDIHCNNQLCSKPTWKNPPLDLNLVNPPIKDTVVVPARGYTVIRFHANNPGYWRLHCHQELHLLEGMDMLIIEGEELVKPPPTNFPQCHDFTWSEEEFASINNASPQQDQGGISQLGVMAITALSLVLFLSALLCCGYRLSVDCASNNQAVMWGGDNDIKYSPVSMEYNSMEKPPALYKNRIRKRKRNKTM